MQDSGLSFFARLQLAFASFSRILGDAAFAQKVVALNQSPAAPAKPPVAPAKPAEAPTENTHASGLAVLGMLQREGRLIDFLQEDMAAFSDAEIGAAARVVHAGSRKILAQYLTLAPVLDSAEGSSVTVPAGFDPNRIRLTGNVSGHPPFRGALKHHGWIATAVRFPTVSAALDARVLAPAEVEL